MLGFKAMMLLFLFFWKLENKTCFPPTTTFETLVMRAMRNEKLSESADLTFYHLSKAIHVLLGSGNISFI